MEEKGANFGPSHPQENRLRKHGGFPSLDEHTSKTTKGPIYVCGSVNMFALILFLPELQFGLSVCFPPIFSKMLHDKVRSLHQGAYILPQSLKSNLLLFSVKADLW